MTPLERAARALETAELGYSIRLARLVDDVSTYTLTMDGMEGFREFPSHGDALDFVQERQRAHKVRAVIEAVRVPSDKIADAIWEETADPCWRENAIKAWQAGIDALLSEPAQ